SAAVKGIFCFERLSVDLNVKAHYKDRRIQFNPKFMAKTLRVGLIGYRFMGKAHSNAWRQAPRFFKLKANVELHTLCGRDAAGVQAARAQLGWQHAVTGWHEIVESPLIDIVDIATPTFSHAEIAIAAAKNGKHVLCEKPLGLNLKECEAVCAA